MKKLIGSFILSYLRFWARCHYKKYSYDVIGITGSVGKTSTLEAVYALLKDKYRVKVSYKANSESGIPLNMLGLTMNNFSPLDWLRVCVLAPIQVLSLSQKRIDVYVVEMGIDSPFPPKNMDFLLSIIRPRVGIFLNAMPVHSEAFDPLIKVSDPQKRRKIARRLIAQEKAKMISALPANGLAILNGSDVEVVESTRNTRVAKRWFEQKDEEALIPSKDADVLCMEVAQSLQGTRFVYNVGGVITELSFPQLLLPQSFADTFAAAFCLGMDEDFTPDETARTLEKNFKMPPGRASLFPGIKGSVILDSSYNASTKPTIELLDVLKRLKAKSAYAILGDMREMGKEARLEHEAVVAHAAEILRELWLVGPIHKQYSVPYLKKKFPNFKVHWAENAIVASKELESRLHVGDVVLVKGSQNTLFMETAVWKLVRDPLKIKSKLCRQGKFWDKQREKVGLSLN